MPAREPTYPELAVERAREWQVAQAKAAAALQEEYARLAQMPDVRDAPALGQPWSHPAIACRCGKTRFVVTRWTTVNGVRHRAELACQACHRVDTWDWTLHTWLQPRLGAERAAKPRPRRQRDVKKSVVG